MTQAAAVQRLPSVPGRLRGEREHHGTTATYKSGGGASTRPSHALPSWAHQNSLDGGTGREEGAVLSLELVRSKRGGDYTNSTASKETPNRGFLKCEPPSSSHPVLQTTESIIRSVTRTDASPTWR